MSWWSRAMAMGWRKRHKDLVTVVRLHGVIAATQNQRGPASQRRLNVDRVEKWFERAFSRSLSAKAVAVTVNSPGGSAVQSELIHQLIRRLSEKSGIPVYTFAEDVAASGGYWILCAGDKLYASKTSIVGSIGVIGGGFGVVELAKRLGIERRIITAGEAKAQLDPFKPVNPEEVERLKEVLADIHTSFKDTVRSSRRGVLIDNADIWTGRIWTGRQAQKLGLVDGVDSPQNVMREMYGDEVQFLTCSDAGRPGLADVLGLSNKPLGLEQLLTSKDAYGVCQEAMQALMDVLEDRSLHAKYGL